MNTLAFVQVTDSIFRLPLQLCGAQVAVFLVRDANDWILVDTGLDRSAETVICAVENLCGGPPNAMVITHGHFDHAGGLYRLKNRWRVPVMAHEQEVAFITGPARYRDLRPASIGYRLLNPFCSPLPCGASVNRALCNGDRVGPLTVIHVPGHTPGMIALLHHQDRALLAADAFRFKLIGAMPLYTYDLFAARQSMRRLAELDFDHLLTSHNDPIMEGGREAAKSAAGV